MKGYLANGFYSPSREFFRMGRSRFNHSLQSQDGNLKSSRFNIEKLLQYEEQVRVIILIAFSFRRGSICLFLLLLILINESVIYYLR